MSAEQNKAMVRRFFEEVWNHGEDDVVDEIFAPTILFNGQSIAEDYTVTYMSGATTLGTNTFSGMADTTSASGFANFSLTSNIANPITSVAITTPNAGNNGWDFFVDTIQLTTAQAPSDTPEPGSTALLIGLSLSGAAVLRRRSRR